MDLPTKVWLANEIRIWGLLATAFVGVISFAANWTHSRWQAELAAQKEQVAKDLQRQSNERIAEAQARAAEANARALEATVELEKFKAPRHIDGDAFVKALEGKPKAPVEIVFVRDDPECYQLAMQIRDWLKVAKWEYSEPAAITGPDETRFTQYPSSMQAGGQPRGVTIVLRATSQADFERERDDPFNDNASVDTPGKALSRALLTSLDSIAQSMNFETGKVGSLRIVVGSK